MSQFTNLRRADTEAAPVNVVVAVTAPAAVVESGDEKPGRVTLTLDSHVFKALGRRVSDERTSKQKFVENLVLEALGLK